MPYALLDERTKKSNRDSLREAIRTLVGYGYNIDPPDQEGENHRRADRVVMDPQSRVKSDFSSSFTIVHVAQYVLHWI